MGFCTYHVVARPHFRKRIFGRRCNFPLNLHVGTQAATTMFQIMFQKTNQVVKPKDIRGASEGSRRTSAETGRSSKATHQQQQQQPRPPRYNAKTSRSASMPSAYPTNGPGEGDNNRLISKRAGGGSGGAGSGGGRGRRYPTGGGESVSSSATSLQGNLGGGSSSRDTSRALKRGEGSSWGGGAGGGGGGASVSSVGSRSGMSDRSR